MNIWRQAVVYLLGLVPFITIQTIAIKHYEVEGSSQISPMVMVWQGVGLLIGLALMFGWLVWQMKKMDKEDESLG